MYVYMYRTDGSSKCIRFQSPSILSIAFRCLVCQFLYVDLCACVHFVVCALLTNTLVVIQTMLAVGPDGIVVSAQFIKLTEMRCKIDKW